jgi:Leucine-rich repeat (LRR) protein
VTRGALRFAYGVAVALVSPGAGLTALHASIGELSSLRRIDLDHNTLTDLPTGITALTGLRSLLLIEI